MTYHEGELAVQARAGVATEAGKIGRIIADTIPAAAAAFLAAQPFVVTSTISAEGIVTASILSGEPGFIRAATASSILIEPRTGLVDQVFSDLHSSPMIGILAIELATRRRMRANGLATVSGRSIHVATKEVYSNCPQYIQPRTLVRSGKPDPRIVRSSTAGPEQLAWISAADTFFIATAHPTAGADASHRGGPPRFVRIESPSELSFHDFRGNNMFNTLGNLEVNPQCGLLFVDFEQGSTLQLAGKAAVRWTDDATRDIAFTIEGVVETRNGLPLRSV